MKNLNEMNRQELEDYNSELNETIVKLREACEKQLQLIAECNKTVDEEIDYLQDQNKGLIELNKTLFMYKNPARKSIPDFIYALTGYPILKGEKSLNDNFIPGGAR